MKNLNNKKNYFITLLSSFGAVIITIILNLLSVPISLNYWKPEKYGICAIIITILVYLGTSNSGLNSAATTLISKNNNYKNKIEIFKKTTILLIISSMFFMILFILLNINNKNWILVLGKIPDSLINETHTAVFFSGILFFINIPISNIASALTGFQKLYVEKIFSVILSIFQFIALIITIIVNGSLITYTVLIGIASITVNIFRVVYFYFEIYKKENSRNNMETDHDDEISYRNIIITSLRFFLIGIAAMIVWNTDNFIISHFLSIKDVTPYSITFKLYNVLFTMIFIINGSMMPLFGKEICNDNWEWLNKVYSYMTIIITILGGLTWIGGVLFFKDVIYLWAGKGSYGGLLVTFSLGGYSYLLSIVNLNAGVLNAFNYNSEVVWIGWLEAIINLILSITFVKQFGIGGTALGTFLASFFSVAWLLPIIIRKRTNHKLNINMKFVLKHFAFLIIPMVLISILIQIFVDNILLRISEGIIIIVIYIFLSYYLVPNDIKKNSKEQLNIFRLRRNN